MQGQQMQKAKQSILFVSTHTHTHTHTLEQPCVTQALEIRVAQLGFKNACPVFIVGAGIITAKD